MAKNFALALMEILTSSLNHIKYTLSSAFEGYIVQNIHTTFVFTAL